MSKPQSEATQIRRLKAECSRLSAAMIRVCAERDKFIVRAAKAEQESTEWRSRFDRLLARGCET